MLKLSPVVRAVLTVLAAAVAALGATSLSLPSWAQAVLSVVTVLFSALGIEAPKRTSES